MFAVDPAAARTKLSALSLPEFAWRSRSARWRALGGARPVPPCEEETDTTLLVLLVEEYLRSGWLISNNHASWIWWLMLAGSKSMTVECLWCGSVNLFGGSLWIFSQGWLLFQMLFNTTCFSGSCFGMFPRKSWLSTKCKGNVDAILSWRCFVWIFLCWYVPELCCVTLFFRWV